eukprot:gene8488-312_t
MNGISQQLVRDIVLKRDEMRILKNKNTISKIESLLLTDSTLDKERILNLTNYLTTNNEQDRVLFDSIFFLIPEINNENISDYYLNSIIVLTIFRTLYFQRRIFKVLRRILLFLGILYLFRSITIILTILPNPNLKCKSNLSSNNIFISSILIMLRINYTCSDLFFSGHSISLGICLYIWLYYNNLNQPFNLLFNLLFILIAITGWLIFIISHFHYSIDVLIGCLLSSFIWIFYHLLISKYSLYSKELSFIIWFEGRRKLKFKEYLNSINEIENNIIKNSKNENEIMSEYQSKYHSKKWLDDNIIKNEFICSNCLYE